MQFAWSTETLKGMRHAPPDVEGAAGVGDDVGVATVGALDPVEEPARH